MATFGGLINRERTYGVFYEAFGALESVENAARQMEDRSDFDGVVDVVRSLVRGYYDELGHIRGRLFAAYLGTYVVRDWGDDLTEANSAEGRYELVAADPDLDYEDVLDMDAIAPVTLRLVASDEEGRLCVVCEASIW